MSTQKCFLRHEHKMKVHLDKEFRKNAWQSHTLDTRWSRRNSTTFTCDYLLNNDCVIVKNVLSSEQFTIACNDKLKYKHISARRFDRHRTGFLHYLWLAIIIIWFGVINKSSANKCARDIETVGWTWPSGDILLESKQPLTILCMLNKTYVDSTYLGRNASDLFFVQNDHEVDHEYISIVNETTIKLYVENPALPAHDWYYCRLRLDDNSQSKDVPVCMNIVRIGYKPQKPKNFNCSSYNWEKLMCTWEPQPNEIETNYNLYYTSLQPPLKGYQQGCPSKRSDEILPLNTCVWTRDTRPMYLQTMKEYLFILKGENALGNVSFNYTFHHFAHVIPAKPVGLTLVNKTSQSAALHWRVDHAMQSFPPGLHHRITYQVPQGELMDNFTIIITSHAEFKERDFEITGLKYANTDYDVQVSMRSAIATREDKWSDSSVITFKTSPRLPALPPRIDMGSFEIVKNSKLNRDIYIYWQEIPHYMENGDNFTYEVICFEEDGRKVFIMPDETTESYAKFENMSFNNYRIELRASNIMGMTPEKTTIFVPSQHEKLLEPLAFTTVEFGDGYFELSWKPPLVREGIINYTIFWCAAERNRPHQCRGYLDWVHVSANTTVKTVRVSSNNQMIYQFAISANAANASSGMVWPKCTIIHNKFVEKMPSARINRVGTYTMEVEWKLDCSDRISTIESFNINYCPVISPHNYTCKEIPQKRSLSADSLPTHYTITDLKPQTTYIVTVAFLTKNGKELSSEHLVNTTYKLAIIPDPQQNVTLAVEIVGGVCGIILLFCLGYISKRMWFKCKAMQDVELILPPGIASCDESFHGADGATHIRRYSSADLSVGVTVSSSLTSESHVTSDSSGTEVKLASALLTTQPEPPTGSETSSRDKRNGIIKSETLTDSTRQDCYENISESDEANLDETTSLIRSTSNFTDSFGFMIYRNKSMLSSKEASLNLSPIPHEDLNIGHHNSVREVFPTELYLKADEFAESLSNTLSASRADVETYVPTASLEQKMTIKPMDYLHGQNDLSFVEQTPIEIQPSMPISALDPTTIKPYVQVGLMNSLKMTFTTPLPIQRTLKQPFTSSALKSYVAVDSLLKEAKSPKPTTKTSVEDRQ